ncbi:MAG: hypothetical protein WCW52_03890 [Elusimicrobiales bacterium]
MTQTTIRTVEFNNGHVVELIHNPSSLDFSDLPKELERAEAKYWDSFNKHCTAEQIRAIRKLVAVEKKMMEPQRVTYVLARTGAGKKITGHLIVYDGDSSLGGNDKLPLEMCFPHLRSRLRRGNKLVFEVKRAVTWPEGGGKCSFEDLLKGAVYHICGLKEIHPRNARIYGHTVNPETTALYQKKYHAGIIAGPELTSAENEYLIDYHIAPLLAEYKDDFPPRNSFEGRRRSFEELLMDIRQPGAQSLPFYG